MIEQQRVELPDQDMLLKLILPCITSQPEDQAISDAFGVLETLRPYLAPVRESVGQPIETLPKDGQRVLLWIEHENIKNCPTAHLDDWRGWCVGSWTHHNGGGLSWYGMGGVARGWMPLPPPYVTTK